MRLAEAHLNGLCEHIHSLRIDSRDDRGHDLLIDTLQNAVEASVSEKSLTVAAEIVKVGRSRLAGLLAGDSCGIQKVFLLELLVELSVAGLGEHRMCRLRLAVCREHGVLALDRVLIGKDSALCHNVGALPFDARAVCCIHNKHRRGNAVKRQFRHVVSLLPD